MSVQSDYKAEETRRQLSKREIIKSFFNWFFFAESNYNYERLQATAFAHAMVPVIEKLYVHKNERVDALNRHLVFFNTEPICGSVIHGITIAMEEQVANNQMNSEGINPVKTGLMGPLAGIGDTLTQGIITPILLALCIGVTLKGNIAGPIIFLLAQYAIMFSISYSLWMNGYKFGKKAVESILEGGLVNKIIEGASILGTMVMGGLVAKFVSLSTKVDFNIGEAAFSLQSDLFDEIMPGLLPLLLTFLVLGMLKKGITPLKIMGVLIGLGAIGGLIGVF